MTILRVIAFLYVIELNINKMLVDKIILSNEFIKIYFRNPNILKYSLFLAVKIAFICIFKIINRCTKMI